MVMVFYEALCPDSKHFILKQLEPTYIKATSIVDFQLVPYGKATVRKLQSDKIEIKCLFNLHFANLTTSLYLFRQTQIVMDH